MYGRHRVARLPHHLADTAHPVTGPALQPYADDTPFADERVIELHIEAGISRVMR